MTAVVPAKAGTQYSAVYREHTAYWVVSPGCLDYEVDVAGRCGMSGRSFTTVGILLPCRI